MSRKEQKYHELAHLLAFKETISDFPNGNIPEDQENPDFPITTPEKTIGIEHTEVFHESKKNGTALQAEENYIFNILHKAKKFYNESKNIPLIVWIDLKIGTDFKKRNIDSIARNLVRIVEENIPEQDSFNEVKRTWEIDDPLPKVVSSIMIIRFGSLTESSWSPIGLSGAMPKVPPEFVQKSIDKKNPKVEDYKKRCAEVWLVIVVYGYLPSTLFEVSGKALSEIYNSNFDRTYLFDFQKKKSFLLKTVSPKS